MRLVQVRAKDPPSRQKRHVLRWVALTAVFVSVVGTILYFRPLPAATLTLNLPSSPSPSTPSIDWPDFGQAEFGAIGYDLDLTNAQPRPVATASMAKVITALCVLEKKPLKLGEAGPSITMTVDDMARLQQQLDQGGSNLRINVGEVLNEYQMLQAMLLPSANNMADSLAVWAFGSLEQYQKYAQDFVKRSNMLHTQIGPDASGFDTNSVSTTADLTKLGKLALANPVIMQIAGTESATFQSAGTIYNTNRLLQNGILTGLKTGTNDGNTGGFLFTSIIKKADRTIPITGVVVNAGSSANANIQAEQLVQSISDDFEMVTYVAANQAIGTARTAWGETTQVVAAKDVSLVRWRANKLWHIEQLRATDATIPGEVGQLTIRTNGAKASTPIKIVKPAKQPSIIWRLTHIR